MENLEQKISKCPKCAGSGIDGNIVCSVCRGIGFGLSLPLIFLYWGKNIDPFEIIFNRWRRAANNFVNFAILILAVLAIVQTGIYFYNFGWLPMAEVATWLNPNVRILIFWIGLAILTFVFYRLALEGEALIKIPRRGYEEEEINLDALAAAPWEQAAVAKQRVDVTRSINISAWRSLERAYELAQNFKHGVVEPAHLFASLLSTPQIGLVFGRLGVDMKKLQESLGGMLIKLPPAAGGRLVWSDALRAAVLGAYVDAYNHRHRLIGPIELFVQAVAANQNLQELLFGLDVDTVKLNNVVSWIRIQEILSEQWREFRAAARLKPRGAMNRAMTAIATPMLDRFSTDLTMMATYGYLSPCVNRSSEINQLMRIIEGGRQSAILIGESGVGKQAIIEGLAQRMAQEDVPKILQDKRLVSLSTAQLVSGATASEAEERLLKVLNEVGVSGNIILVVPHIDKMVGITSGSEQSIDLAEVFANELGRGYFISIATSRPGDYTRAIESRTLGNRMQKIDVGELDEDTAIRVLEAKAGSIEYENKVFFTYDAIDKAVRLTAKLMHERYLPDKAIEIIKEAALEVRKTRGEKALVTGEDAAKIITEKTKVPVTAITGEESEKLLKLEDEIHKRVIGQHEAVKAVSAALRRARAELREKKRPIANFLFLGPTGVGKTELSKTVAEVYFGDENNMIRLDMSEYQEKTSIYRLIGAPGDKEGGILTEMVRKKPFALILLDEIEKAHPDILNAFLQVMDDGRLTDNLGRTVDFTNAIIIMTSNAGTDFIQEEIKKNTPVAQIQTTLVQEKLKQYFRPEFLNRFDGVIVFAPLTREEVLQIAWLQLSKLQGVMEEKGIHLRVTEEAAEELATAGFDPLFGARPLKRVIHERVNDALANYLLTGKIGRRDIVYLEKGGQLRIEKAAEL
ncbi:MAG: ATP-dependent Clp protease ATP-binding subunit [Patescibacteria group bacterium]|nr:ATP-dependent Clp protease ATP-binding subunit [Patescibacteria group bacterium]